MKTIQLTPEYRKRVTSSITEHQNIINREMRHSADLRNNDLVTRYQKSIEELNEALRTGYLISNI